LYSGAIFFAIIGQYYEKWKGNFPVEYQRLFIFIITHVIEKFFENLCFVFIINYYTYNRYLVLKLTVNYM